MLTGSTVRDILDLDALDVAEVREDLGNSSHWPSTSGNLYIADSGNWRV